MERSGLACFWMFLVILSMYGEAGLVRLRPLLFALCCRRSCQDSCQVIKNSEDIEKLHFSKRLFSAFLSLHEDTLSSLQRDIFVQRCSMVSI